MTNTMAGRCLMLLFILMFPAHGTSKINATCTTVCNKCLDLICRATCPPGCASTKYYQLEVWGVDIYSADSNACRAAIHAGVSSNETSSEFIIVMQPGEKAYRGSTRNGITTSKWDSPWDRSCIFKDLHSAGNELLLLSKVNVTTNNIEMVARDLAVHSTKKAYFSPRDLSCSSRILANIANVPDNKSYVGNNILKTVSHILQANETVIEQAQVETAASTRTVTAVERFLQNIDLRTQHSYSFVEPSSFIAMEVWRTNDRSDQIVGFDVSSACNGSSGFHNHSIRVHFQSSPASFENANVAVRIPLSVLKALQQQNDTPSSAGPDRLTFVIYGNSKLFNPVVRRNVSGNRTFQVNSQVLSISIGGAEVQNMLEPVQLMFTPVRNVTHGETICVFWNFTLNDGLGDWSPRGCKLNATMNGKIICHCSHMTNFAILMGTFGGHQPSHDHSTVLNTVSLIGITLSIVGLTATVITFLALRCGRKRHRMDSQRSQMALFNLALALLCADIAFITGIERTENTPICMAVAAVIYYFLLVAFLWMTIYAVVMYVDLVKDVLSARAKKSWFLRKAAVPAWGMPLIIVVLVAAINNKTFHGPARYCWLAEDARHFAFMLPVGIMIVVNTILFALVLRSITIRHKRMRAVTSPHYKAKFTVCNAFASLLIFSIIGSTWTFGFLAIGTAATLFQYLFCILNSSQGVFVFILFIVSNPNIRHMVKHKIRKEERDRNTSLM